jgi:glycogen synthase
LSPYSATAGSEQPCVSRVLMTTDTVGGVWTYALELSRALAPHGIDVVLATMGPRPSSQQQIEAARIDNLTLIESDYDLEWMTDPWRSVAAAGHWLRDLADQFDPHVIHLNGYTHAALPWRVPVVVVAHSCVLSWWKAVKGSSATAEWDRYRRHVRHGLNAADLVIAPTYAMADMLKNHYGRLPKLRVIHNAVDHSHFSRGKKKPFVLAAGRLWDEAKNIEVLAQAAKQVSWPVIVAGDTCDPQGRSRQFENVRLVGRLDAAQMPAMMSNCAIYALPARYNPF